MKSLAKLSFIIWLESLNEFEVHVKSLTHLLLTPRLLKDWKEKSTQEGCVCVFKLSA